MSCVHFPARVERMRQLLMGCLLSVGALLLGATTANAKLVQLEVMSRDIAFDGQHFGAVGQYEVIRARAHFRVDPTRPVNAGLVNVHRAPRGEDGLIAFDADVVLLKPRDVARGNGRLIYEMVNRGRPLGLSLLNRANGPGTYLTKVDAGDGFLLEAGFSYVISGWQAEYPLADAPTMAVALGSRLPRAPQSTILTARLPIARESDGSSVIGATREQFFDVGAGPSFVGHLAYAVADRAAPAQLTMREHHGVPSRVLPASSWRFVDEWRIEVTKPAGTSAGALFELVYQAKDPVVYGLALASMRDIVAFLRYEPTANNPLSVQGRSAITHALGLGASQTGRTLKELISEFNEDEDGRIALDGA